MYNAKDTYKPYFVNSCNLQAHLFICVCVILCLCARACVYSLRACERICIHVYKREYVSRCVLFLLYS